MLVVTRYTVEKGPGAYRIRARDPPLCPACGVLLSGYDTRPRRVVDSSGAVLLFQLRRLRCPSCHRLHLELPDFMRPYKHYASPVIEAVEAGATASCPADNSTMRRWKKSPTHFACPSSPGSDTIGTADEGGVNFMRDKLVLSLGALCAVAFILLAGMVGYHMGAGATTPVPAAAVDLPPAASATASAVPATAPEGATTIPGFDKLQITASAGQQAAPFYNPAGNICYFVISLFLPSGEEIFRSGLVPPGESLSTMTLASVPPTGVYKSSVLRYSCYSLDSMQPMNGADVKLTIEII